MLAKEISKKNLHILDEGASGCTSGVIEQVIVNICLKHDIITLNRWFFYKNIW